MQRNTILCLMEFHENGGIQLNIGTQAGFHVRNTVVHLFLDPRSKIQIISVLLKLRKTFC